MSDNGYRSTKTENKKMKSREQSWSEYLNNKNVRPKVYNLSLRRDEQGNFFAIGGQTLMADNKGHSANWVKVDTRDLVKVINEAGIKAL